MRRILCVALLGLLICPMLVCGADAPSPTTAPSELATLPPPDAPLPPGMRRIFDGKTLDGWKQIPPDSGVAKNGVLASRGVGRGVLSTEKRFDRYRAIF